MNLSDIYYISPRKLQSFMISAKSFTMRYRYSCEPQLVHQSLSYLDENYSSLCEERFNNYLKFASRYVPFYRDCLKKLGLSWPDVNISNYRQIFPVINKEIVKDCVCKFTPDHKTQERNFLIHTSGTTGQPLSVYTNKSSRMLNFQHFNSLLLSNGVRPKDNSVTIGGKRLFSRPKNNCYWRNDYYANNRYFSNYHLNAKTVGIYLNEFETYDPVYIDSYPFPISYIAKYMNSIGRVYRGHNLKLILTSSEALLLDDRVEIERAFGCKVVNHYGNAEMSVFAYGYDDTLYFPGSYGQVEFEYSEGGEAEIISSGMVNTGMVLLRYKTGDTVNEVFSNEICGTVTSVVNGRSEDYIELADGRRVTQFNPISGLQSVRQAQVIQKSFNHIDILVDTELDMNTIAMIRKSVLQKLDPNMEVKIVKVNDFILTKSGKFRFIRRMF
jgi:phenylacetate-CoA ligase